MEKVETFEDMKTAKRLWIGELINHSQRTGRFIEIKDVPAFIAAEEEQQRLGIKRNCLDKGYIDWHNFHYE
jgi:hypothetical protein